MARKWNKGVVVPLSTLAWSPAAMLSSFIKLQARNTALQEKRTITGDLQYIHIIEGTQFPKGLKLVQQKNKHIYN